MSPCHRACQFRHEKVLPPPFLKVDTHIYFANYAQPYGCIL